MPGAKQELIIPRRLFSKSLHKKEKGALHKCFPSSSITYRLLQNVGTELTAPARSQPGAQEVTDQLWMTDGSRTPAVMDGVGLGPQKASEELCAVQFCLPQTCPSPPATSQPSPVTAQPSLGAQEGLPGWLWEEPLQEEPLDPLPCCLDHGTAVLRVRATLLGTVSRAGQGHFPWTTLHGDG